jgi:hypothetical protein
VTVTDANGCNAMDTAAIVFSNSITVDITGPVAGCTGSAASLCVPPGYSSYAWNTGQTTECISVTAAGNYSVTVHDPVGCVANAFYNLNFYAPPVTSITGQPSACSGDTVTWCASGSFPVYSWSNGDSASCVELFSSGNYSVTVTDTNGCVTTAYASLSIADLDASIIHTGGYLVCDTFNTQFTYSWLYNGTPATGCTGDSCVPGASGIYSVIVNDFNGCSDTAEINYIHTGISASGRPGGVVIYPNPVTGNELFLGISNLDGPSDILLFDNTGRLITNWNMPLSDESIVRLDIEGIATGIYFIRVQTGGQQFTRRLMISREY